MASELQSGSPRGTTFGGKPFAVLFCIAYVSFLVVSAPCAPVAIRQSSGNLKACLRRVGLVHDFVVFAPDVPSFDSSTEALIENADGTVSVWNLSKLDQLPPGDRPAAERFRKLFDERVSNIGYRAIWPDVAEYIATACATDSVVPQRVSIIRVSKPIGVPPYVGESGKVQTLCTYALAAGGPR